MLFSLRSNRRPEFWLFRSIGHDSTHVLRQLRNAELPSLQCQQWDSPSVRRNLTLAFFHSLDCSGKISWDLRLRDVCEKLSGDVEDRQHQTHSETSHSTTQTEISHEGKGKKIKKTNFNSNLPQANLVWWLWDWRPLMCFLYKLHYILGNMIRRGESAFPEAVQSNRCSDEQTQVFLWYRT